jgi:Flp pilus assembly pilin Flp
LTVAKRMRQRWAEFKLLADTIMVKARKGLRATEAEDLTEYALLLVLIALVAVGSLRIVGQAVSNVFSNAAANVVITDEFDGIRRSVRGLYPGNIAFNAPASMEVDRSYEIYLDLSGSRPVAELQRNLEQRLKTQNVVGKKIHIAPRMEARLTGETFKVLAITDEIQAVVPEQVTGWRWEVTPTRGGMRELHLTLSAILDVDRLQPTPYSIKTFDTRIQVHVTTRRRLTDWLHDHWEWTVATLGAIVIGLRRLWKKRKQKKSEERIANQSL